MGVAMPPDWLKPATIGEVIFACSRGASRGDWRWRVGKEKPRNLRDPGLVLDRTRKSDAFIVVKKQGNACGAKGGDCKYAEVKV